MEVFLKPKKGRPRGPGLTYSMSLCPQIYLGGSHCLIYKTKLVCLDNFL